MSSLCKVNRIPIHRSLLQSCDDRPWPYTESRWVFFTCRFRNDGRIGVCQKEVIWSTSSFTSSFQGIYVVNRRAFRCWTCVGTCVTKVVMFLNARRSLHGLLQSVIAMPLFFSRTLSSTNRNRDTVGDKLESFFINRPCSITPSVIMRINK